MLRVCLTSKALAHWAPAELSITPAVEGDDPWGREEEQRVWAEWTFARFPGERDALLPTSPTMHHGAHCHLIVKGKEEAI